MRRLRAAIGPDRWLVVEKILGVGEALPASWPVDGTSGYEALREIQGVFVDPDGAGLLTQFAAEHTGRKESLHEAEHAARLEVARTILAAEVARIARECGSRAANPARPSRPTPSPSSSARFPVYRSYLPEGREALDTALSVARIRRPDLADQLTALHAAMLADPHGALATRIQQTSGMVMAKGVEDTTYYRWNRFVALNEVGGDPSRFGVSPRRVPRRDGRARGGLAGHHDHAVHPRHQALRGRAGPARRAGRDPRRVDRRCCAGGRRAHPLPDRSLELLAWQCLVGAWPISADRLAGYLGKAAKEAKLVTSHVDAVPEVDEAIAGWPAQVLADAELVAEIERFVERIAGPGWSNSLGQKLLQIAGPGVPDVYQGTELFEYSLVDPDNRRPVDWAAAARAADPARRRLAARVDAEGAAKLLVTASALRLRRYRPEVFAGYRPLPAAGPAADHAVAFQRSPALVAVATRLPVGLAAAGGWRDTVLPLPDGGHRLVGRDHRRAGRARRAPGGRPAEPLPGGAAGPPGLTEQMLRHKMLSESTGLSGQPRTACHAIPQTASSLSRDSATTSFG